MKAMQNWPGFWLCWHRAGKPPMDIIVDPENGDDNNPGTKGMPIRTLTDPVMDVILVKSQPQFDWKRYHESSK